MKPMLACLARGRVFRSVSAAAALILAGGSSAQTVSAPVSQAAPDPARLAVAQRVVGKLLPVGIYRQVMGQTLDQVMDSMMGSMGEMPIADVARLTGISAEDAAKLGAGTIGEVMEVYDPHWNERLRLTTRAMTDAMAELMDTMEPASRDALSRAYARAFTAAELAEIDSFFATPAGARYAANSMALFADPEMVKAMSDMMPQITKQMPDIMTSAEAATRHLPKPRTNKDLTPAERTKLAGLLGVDATALEKNPEQTDHDSAEMLEGTP